MLKVLLNAPAQLDHEAVRRVMHDEVLAALSNAIAVSSPLTLLSRVPRRASYKQAYLRAREYLESRSDGGVTIDDLCRASGFNARILFYAFQERVGVGPLKFLRLRRMSLVRRALHEGGVRLRVADVAARYGFWEPARFAREYRQLFGELPSQTLGTTPQAIPVGATAWSLDGLRRPL
jgi:AraC family ethanolamine operon transcriptional activator